MAVNLVTVTGNLETLIGATPTAGRLWFKLNRPDWSGQPAHLGQPYRHVQGGPEQHAAHGPGR